MTAFAIRGRRYSGVAELLFTAAREAPDSPAVSFAGGTSSWAEVESRCPEFELVSPRSPAKRGSQVSFRYADSYSFIQALIERGVIGDFRPPDVMRFGIAPLYLEAGDLVRAAGVMEELLSKRNWERPRGRPPKAANR